ncbi:hypothetical protein [Archangium sp.]|uniref:hypothetical protein n=1 Tax=Archangium sp. TaxID=1872627 RepID=UPI00286B946A|nr:hypothetical protein [Archangium sp.]
MVFPKREPAPAPAPAPVAAPPPVRPPVFAPEPPDEMPRAQGMGLPGVSDVPGLGPADIARKALSLVGGNIQALGAGAQLLTDLGKTVVGDVLGAGKGRAEVLTFAPAGPAMAVAQLTRNALGALGVTDERLVKPLEQAAALGPLAPSVLLVHAGREVLKAVAPEAEKAISGVVKLADFTDPKQPAGQLLAGANAFIKDVLLGSAPKPPAPPPPPPPPPKKLEEIRYTAAAVANARAKLEARGDGF